MGLEATSLRSLEVTLKGAQPSGEGMVQKRVFGVSLELVKLWATLPHGVLYPPFFFSYALPK